MYLIKHNEDKLKENPIHDNLICYSIEKLNISRKYLNDKNLMQDLTIFLNPYFLYLHLNILFLNDSKKNQGFAKIIKKKDSFSITNHWPSFM